MTIEKPTSAQLQFWIVKGIHLLAAALIVGFLVFYFGQDETPDTPEEVSNQPAAVLEEEPALSGYELFCRNNQDISCGNIHDFVPADEMLEAPQIVLADKVEEAERMELAAENGQDALPEPADVNRLLDRLYEEQLPEDVIDEIDESAPFSESSVKALDVPKHKPPYFGDKPVVVIVIDDMGVSLKRTADIISLNYPLTAAFLTYGKRLDEQLQAAKKAGLELMLHTPMEPFGKADVAPDVLTTQMSLQEIKTNFEAMLQKFDGIKGINNHMGSRLTEDKARMAAVMDVLKDRDLFFLDSKTSAKSKAEEAAKEAGIPYAHRHVFLDNSNDKAYILGQLDKLEALARKNGYAIAIGHPKTQTFAALNEWLPQMNGKGLELWPLSRVIRVLNPSVDF